MTNLSEFLPFEAPVQPGEHDREMQLLGGKHGELEKVGKELRLVDCYPIERRETRGLRNSNYTILWMRLCKKNIRVTNFYTYDLFRMSKQIQKCERKSFS